LVQAQTLLELLNLWRGVQDFLLLATQQNTYVLLAVVEVADGLEAVVVQGDF
jgi:hypothetical protein